MQPRLEAMGHELSYVAQAGPECRIYRSSSGHYVVQQSDRAERGHEVATLACAYAACQVFSDEEEGSGPSPPAERR